MELEELEKRQCITYADETNPFTFGSHTGITANCVVSYTSRRCEYVNTVEKNWLEMRAFYGLQEGLALHFTDLRTLINYQPGTLSNKETKRQRWLRFFSNSDGKVDLGKLHSFYSDVLSQLKMGNGYFLITGMLSSTAHLGNKEFVSYAVQEPIVQVFSEHLNLLVAVLSHAYLPKDRRTGLRQKPWVTKLRYDGDAALAFRGPLRMAYHQSILHGTRQFKAELVRDVIDEIRFVGKDEVGFYQKGHPDMSHIGNEITDFAATFLSRSLFREEFVDLAVQVGQFKSSTEAETVYEDLVRIKIPGYPVIDPLTVLRDRVFREGTFEGVHKVDSSPLRYSSRQ